MKVWKILVVLLALFAIPFVSAANYNITNKEVNDTLDVNSPPEITSIVFTDAETTDPIDPKPNDVVLVWCNASVTDFDGDNDIDSAWAEIWLQGHASNEDYEYLENHSCTILNQDGGDNDVYVSCAFEVKHYIRPGEWNCSIHVNDSRNQVTDGMAEQQVTELLAFNVDQTEMNFGTLAWGDNSSTSLIEKVIANWGNVPMNLDLHTMDRSKANNWSMQCDSQHIPAKYLKVGETGTNYDSLEHAFDDATGLVSSVLSSALNPGTASQPAPSTSIYFGIKVPDSDEQTADGVYPIKGTCRGVVIFNAVKA